MSARVSFESSGGKGSQGPAWGLKEQLKRFDNDAGKDVTGSTDGKNRPATTKSKIRVSVTGPGLADKIRQVKIKRYTRGRVLRINPFFAT